MKKPRPERDCLVCFGIQEVSEFCLGDGVIKLSEGNAYFNFPGSLSFERRSLAFDLGFTLEDNCLTIKRCFCAGEPNID